MFLFHCSLQIMTCFPVFFVQVSLIVAIVTLVPGLSLSIGSNLHQTHLLTKSQIGLKYLYELDLYDLLAPPTSPQGGVNQNAVNGFECTMTHMSAAATSKTDNKLQFTFTHHKYPGVR